ncbi:TldD/PmbA family protein [Allorhizocola rhizosphaerae]|uniref:TldD/PmbA family protein n=1 Tax=Allorhizocola rhizosphaerae TaxID=1872709 RepID=UPI000E3DD099|nr:metallopeptidase TldD-related protein [Allorhizocola rhizosphaerae]
MIDQIFEQARKALPGADIEVTVEHNRAALTRFANSFIHQNVAEDTTTVGLRVHHEGRTIALSTTADPQALIDRAAAILGDAPRDPGWPGLAPAASLAGTPQLDPTDPGPDARAEVVRGFVEAAGGLSTAGYCRTVRWAGSYRNSAGQALDATATSADMDGIARHDGADGVARRHAVQLSDIDGAALGARAAASARAQGDPVELPPGRYEVVLQPEAVADILSNFSYHGFNGKYLNDGRCFAHLGEAQFDPAVSIYDDPFAGVGGRPFDHEGTPRGHLSLVEHGVTRTVAYDRRSAAEAGTASTGHALSDDNWGPMAVNLAFAGGSSSAEQMISEMRRGILVSDFWYTRVLDPRTLVITGLTRNGAWLVEHGEIVRPVRNFRFTQGYVSALAPGRVLGIGAEVTPLPNIRRELQNVSCPAMRLASWNFTGGASG